MENKPTKATHNHPTDKKKKSFLQFLTILIEPEREKFF